MIPRMQPQPSGAPTDDLVALEAAYMVLGYCLIGEPVRSRVTNAKVTTGQAGELGAILWFPLYGPIAVVRWSDNTKRWAWIQDLEFTEGSIEL